MKIQLVVILALFALVLTAPFSPLDRYYLTKNIYTLQKEISV